MLNNLNVKIDKNAMDWMHKKRKKALTLTVNMTGGGCCPTFELADVSYSKPSHEEKYLKFEQQGMPVYVSKNTRVLAPTLHFVLKKTLFGSTIEAEGINLKERE